MPLSWRDRVILGGLRAVPKPLAKHALFLLKSESSLADDLGYHIRPIHYYEPLPDFRDITPDATERRRVSPAIDFALDRQRQLARRLGVSYGAELDALTKGFDFTNEYFAGLDAGLYYALIRELGPSRVIEVGAGMSTRIASFALQRNRADGRGGLLTCIEPDPQPRLTDNMPDVELIASRIEDVPLERFDALEAGDILFIDSSHALRFGGDVCREYLEILPRLKPGVWIHVHDIFFPQDYPARWLVEQRLAFNEQYLLEAFLAFNRAFAVRAVNFWLAADHLEDVRALAPAGLSADTHHGRGSFWMQRIT